MHRHGVRFGSIFSGGGLVGLVWHREETCIGGAGVVGCIEWW